VELSAAREGEGRQARALQGADVETAAAQQALAAT
jgi:hypothetical protein